MKHSTVTNSRGNYATPCKSRPNGRHGSALVAIVAALVVFSVLTAALLPMISSSGQQAAMGLLAEKALYMAESGYRYAVSRYRHPSEPGLKPSDILEAMDQKSYSLANGDRFSLAIYSYFLTTTAAVAAGQTTFTALAPGSFPAYELNVGQYSGQKIQIDGDIYTIASAAMEPASDDRLTISVDEPLPTTAEKTEIYPVAQSIDSSQSVSHGGSIEYRNGQGRMFPLRNGLIVVAGRALIYGSNNVAEHRLENVREPDVDSAALVNLTIDSKSEILLVPYARIVSTGITGGGESETRRTISFYSAFGPKTPPQKIAFEKNFSDGSSFTNPEGQGSTKVVQLEGDSNPVLKVSRSEQGKSLAVLDNAQSRKDLADFYRSSHGYISYDAQAKFGLFPEPEWTRADFVTGLSFRLRPDAGGQAGYGLSFLKSRVPTGSDGIPGSMVPPGSDNERSIVLWQQPQAGQNPVWLAYKKIFEQPPSSFFDFESGPQGWQANNNWTWSTPGATGSSGAFHCTIPASLHANASLRSPKLTLSDSYPKVTLVFKTKYEQSAQLTTKKVRIINWADGQPIAKTGKTISGAGTGGEWKEEKVDLSQVKVREIAIEFNFEAYLSFQEQNWSVDDIRIVYEWPIQDSALVVRLKEAAVIEFTQGGPNIITEGEQLFGENSGASGTVIAPPVLSKGSWAAGNAEGTLLLNELPAGIWFRSGEGLLAVGKGRLANLKGAPDQEKRRKVNVIKAYYASKDGAGEPDDIATNRTTRPYPRLVGNASLKWPVDEGREWSAEQDYFRLLQWDGINTINNADTEVSALRVSDPLQANTILSCYNRYLQSPEYGAIFSAPELGLHAMGLKDIVERAYYDDFGYQLVVVRDYSLPYSFQQ